MSKIDTSPAALRALADDMTLTLEAYLHASKMALHTVADEKEAQGWRPIETAPVDEEVDLWDGRRRTNCWLVTAGTHPGKWYYWGHDEFGKGDFVEVENPTHWAPLPKGPKT